jgi:glucose/arabinose dehydrogenase
LKGCYHPAMKLWKKALLILLALSVLLGAAIAWYLASFDSREPSRLAYLEHCAGCHGADLSGTATGSALIDRELAYGADAEALIRSIRERHLAPESNYSNEQLSDPTVKALALYIIERRQRLPTIGESQQSSIPDTIVSSQYHDFVVEVITELQGAPYSIAPLPDGRILVSEKNRGLSIVETNGIQGALVEGTPRVWSEIIKVRGSYVGIGMMLDVELHPEYEDNGWIYLSHSDRCQLDCGTLLPVSMVRVIRGRLDNGRWVDTEVIWSVDRDHYTVVPDGVAGGRLAFDHRGYLYVTVGGKSTYDNLHKLDTPYGKIHRVRDNGELPQDNPFLEPAEPRTPSSTRHTVWSYGHRTTQGLSAHPVTGAIWSSEMGPRGGDEINLIVPGGNYGWPLYTEGLDYDATPISIGTDLGLEFPLADTVQPVVDFTPSPSVSNFTFHQGSRFPGWQNDLLLGSLRARTLFRLRIEDGQLLERERLLSDLGRIRDVEMGPDGLVYLLIEDSGGGLLLRLVPR